MQEEHHKIYPLTQTKYFLIHFFQRIQRWTYKFYIKLLLRVKGWNLNSKHSAGFTWVNVSWLVQFSAVP